MGAESWVPEQDKTNRNPTAYFRPRTSHRQSPSMDLCSSRRAKPLQGRPESVERWDETGSSDDAYALAYFVLWCLQTTYTLDRYTQAGRAEEDMSKVRGRKEAYEGHALDASSIALERACRA